MVGRMLFRAVERFKWCLFYILYTKDERTDLFDRVTAEVGFSGHGRSLIDKTEEEMPPLSRFQRWMLASLIADLRVHHQYAWRKACIEVLGEDPEEWK